MESLSISPRSLIPSSRTAYSVSFSIDITESGTPIRLFLFPFVTYASDDAAKTKPVMSFVVVFPTLPVMHMVLTSGHFSRLYQSARAYIAAFTSGTSTVFLTNAPSRSTKAAFPETTTASTKSWASRFSPRNAKNKPVSPCDSRLSRNSLFNIRSSLSA